MAHHSNFKEKEMIAEFPFSFEGMIGTSACMQNVFNVIHQVARTDATILLEGETGTGKELAARAIHNKSLRMKKPFIALNCAALSDSLLESELFGHEKGAFTGACSQRHGHFERANRGTLFLDEIGDMSPSAQAKVLRIIEHGEFERVGGNQTHRTDFRLIVASNKDLETSIKEKKFREDLFHRISVIKIFLPPLRERGQDVLVLANFFIRKFSSKFSKPIKQLDQRAKQHIARYSWPGNIRELQNAIERAIIRSSRDTISLSDLRYEDEIPDSDPSLEFESNTLSIKGLKEKIEEMEKKLIIQALQETQGRRNKAAGLLEVSTRTLLTKIHKYRISPREGRPTRKL